MITEINEQLFWWINGAGGGAGDMAMILFTVTGYSIPAFLIGVGAIYLYRGISRKNVILLAIVLIAGGVVVQGIKQTYSAPRPLKHFAKKTPPVDDKVSAPFTQLKSRTFPSGHSQTVFGVATFIVLLFRRHVPIWFGWAALVAISRVQLGLHFPIDIIAGSILGGVAAFITLRLGTTAVKAGDPQAEES